MLLPPYAKEIRKYREAGNTPEFVNLYWTWDWHYPSDKNRFIVMLRPEYYESGKYDFQFLAGLIVHITVENNTVTKDSIDGEFLKLLIEIGRYAGIVFINDLQDRPVPGGDLGSIIPLYKEYKDGVIKWPDGWSDELHDDYNLRSRKLFDYLKEQGRLND